MKTMVEMTWVVFLNQQSCPETLDKQRLSFCLGCGAERYVLSGDCAPRPPFILRGPNTHRATLCGAEGWADTAKAAHAMRLAQQRYHPSTFAPLSTTALAIIVICKVPMTIWVACVHSDSHSLAHSGDMLQTSATPHKSIPSCINLSVSSFQ